MRSTADRTEESTALTARTELDLLALSAFGTTALLCLGERFQDLPGALIAFAAAAMVVVRPARR